jgi:hypothetical protein
VCRYGVFKVHASSRRPPHREILRRISRHSLSKLSSKVRCRGRHCSRRTG